MIKLTPSVKDYLWGGEKLKRYGIEGGSPLAEAWMLSMHKDGESKTENNENLSSAVSKKDWGSAASKFPFFPVLIKLIDALDNLSVQVHPSDDYALKNENSFGKTEMWYVLEAEKGCGLYVGLKDDLTKQELENSLTSGTILEKLNFFPVKKGDCFFIDAGTIHAIGKGCVIAEVQQNSNLTYRLYDYNRTDAAGNTRPLHIEKAIAVSSLKKFTKRKETSKLAECDYFTVEKMTGNGNFLYPNSFAAILVTGGAGKINGKPVKMCDCFYCLPSEKIAFESTNNDFEFLVTTVK